MTRKYSKHLAGDERAELRAKAAELYRAGCSIRSVAAHIGRSYGNAYVLLQEAGVTFRTRSGAARTAAA